MAKLCKKSKKQIDFFKESHSVWKKLIPKLVFSLKPSIESRFLCDLAILDRRRNFTMVGRNGRNKLNISIFNEICDFLPEKYD